MKINLPEQEEEVVEKWGWEEEFCIE